jgi:hypothetical protein
MENRKNIAGYYIPANPKTDGRNRRILVTMFDEDWSHTMAALRHMACVYRRDMLPEEVDDYKDRARYRPLFIAYKNLEGLLEDEERYCVASETRQQIAEALKSFRPAVTLSLLAV